MSGGGLRRYSACEAAIQRYVQLVASLECAPALDMEVACNRPSGGSSEVRSEPEGLDDLMALRRLLRALHAQTTAAKWRLWELQRLNLMSCRDAARHYNEEILAQGAARTDCIERQTALNWRCELDGLFELALVKAGMMRVRREGEE